MAQPLYDLLARHVEFLVAHDAQPVDLVTLVLALSVGLPLGLLAIWALLRRIGAMAASVWLTFAVATLAALGALPVLERLALGGTTTLALALAAGGVAALLYARVSAARQFLAVLSPSAAVFAGVFLFFSPVRQLMIEPPASETRYSRIRAETPVILVVFDEFPLVSLLDAQENVDAKRYPHLAALSEDSHWFRNATTSAQDTTYAVPVIVTGRLPDRRRAPTLADYPHSLFTLLGHGGYRLHVIESHTQLCPEELCGSRLRPAFEERLEAIARDLVVVYQHLVLPAELASSLPPIDATWKGFSAERQSPAAGRRKPAASEKDRAQAESPRRAGRLDSPWLFEQLLASLRGDGRKSLFFAHLMVPHIPWKYLPSGREYGPIGASLFPHGVSKETWVDDEWQVLQGYQRHLLQVGYVDRLIGELVSELRRAELYEPSLIVITADHGASFRPGDRRRTLSAGNFSEVLNVPLLIKLPGQRRGEVSDRNVESIDILPTIADVLGIEVPWTVDGQSLIASEVPERRLKVAYKTNKQDIQGREEYKPAAIAAGRRRALRQKITWFGDGTRPDGLYRIGAHPELLGREAAGWRRQQPGEGPVAEIDQPWQFEAVDPAAPVLPVHVTGRIDGVPSGRDLELAVVLNGIVEAVTRTYRDDRGRLRFSAMMREKALLEGDNAIEIHAVRKDGAEIWLQPLSGTAADRFELLTTPSGEVVRTADGREIPIVANHFRGGARIRSFPLGTYARGWVKPRNGRHAERVLLFARGRFLHSAPVEPAKAKAGGKPPHGRFDVNVPGTFVEDRTGVRLIVLDANAASELPLQLN